MVLNGRSGSFNPWLIDSVDYENIEVRTNCSECIEDCY